MEKAFFENTKSSYAIDLSESQKKAVLHNNGPALVLAVPGAGKTTVLISRVAYLVSVHGVSPSSILSITFSKSSATDMLNRFRSTFGKDLDVAPKFSTIHSFAYFVIKDYCRKANLSYRLIEDSGPNGKASVLRSIYSEINKGFLSDDKLEELINGIGYIKNMMIPPEDFKPCGVKNFDSIYNAYEKHKAEQNLIDFDDMLSLCFNILRENDSLLNMYRNRFKYVQVDEGQDTSNLQHKIISLLAHPLNNLFIVADDDQSVYGFRGANPEYLLSFKEKYPKALIFNMNRNYRSTVDIVAMANSFIKKNKARYDKDIVSHSKERLPINVFNLSSRENQYEYIVENLNLSELDDTAILFRNNLSAIPIVDILERKGIPFKLKDSKLTFFNHWLLKDLSSFLNLALDQSDLRSFQRIYHKMKGYISKRGLNFASDNLKDEKSVFSVLETFPELKPFQKKCMRTMSLEFAKLGKKRPLEAIELIESDLEYLKYLNDKSEFLGYGLENSLNLMSYIKSIASRCISILDFLDRLHYLKELLSTKKEDSGIFVSTMHSAKGLEFNTVFIIDLINGDFPSLSTIDSMKNDVLEPLEEERRLFYVGMTRAKKSLNLLSYSYKNGSKVFPSMFLSEVNSFLSDEQAERIKVNSFVEHADFGKGVILDIDSSSILIDFKLHGTKQLHKSTCIAKNLLKLTD